MKFLKTALIAAGIISFLLISQSCKKKTKEEESTDEVEMVLGSERSEDKTDSEGTKNCDDFLDQYEEWSKEYVSFLSKYKDNPVKAVTSPEYSEMMLKASSWSQEWLSLSMSCAQNQSYEERVQEITDNMDAKMKELGFVD